MLVSNSSPRTEKAPAYGCPNQNPRHAANELAAQTHWGPRQNCRCGWASGTLVRGSDTNSPTQEDGRPARSCRYPADFPKIICTAAREIVVMRRVEFRSLPIPCAPFLGEIGSLSGAEPPESVGRVLPRFSVVRVSHGKRLAIIRVL